MGRIGIGRSGSSRKLKSKSTRSDSCYINKHPMISPLQLSKILRAARKHKVSKLIFENGDVCTIEFFGNVEISNPVSAVVNTTPTIVTPFNNVPVENVPVDNRFADMPTDEEFRFFHSPMVPVEKPLPQEEIRKAS